MTGQKSRHDGFTRRFLALMLALTMIFQQSYVVFASEGDASEPTVSAQADDAAAAEQAAAEQAA